MYHVIGDSAAEWLASLPSSTKPLLDVGAAYGVHTLHAMRHGRDVLALDCDKVHLAELRRRADNLVADTPAADRPALGNLAGTVFAKLPKPDALPPASVSGVLLSEMMHFLHPGEPQRLFEHISHWIQPGGKVVATMGSFAPVALSFASRPDFFLRDGWTIDKALEALTWPDQELLDAAPGIIMFKKHSPYRKDHGIHVYLYNLEEVAALCRLTGFVVERLEYVSLGKYPTADPINEPECVLLVARKPKL